MYNNINGFLTKKESVTKIVSTIDPDIIALCETKKVGRIRKDQLSAYNVMEKNLKRGKEGILFGVKEGTFVSVQEITDTELKNIMTVKIEYPKFNLRVVVGHAPQETEKNEARLEFFEELAVQVERCFTSGDELLILCDFNGRINWEEDHFTAISESPNGKQMCELIHKHSLKVGNFHDKCVGKWTRIQNCLNGEVKRSTLDYILSSAAIHNSVKSILIDEEKIYCPYRVKKKRGILKVVYSDHCVIVADLDIDTGRVRKKGEKISGWRYCEDGFSQYKLESEASIQFDLSGPSASTVYSSWTVEFEKLLAKCFRRRTYKPNSGKNTEKLKYGKIRDIIMEISKKGKIQRSVAKMYQKKLVQKESEITEEARAERLRSTSSKLTIDERFSPSGYWKLKKAASIGVRKDQCITSVVKENGVEVDGADAIIQAYQDEFVNRLRSREPKCGWEDYTAETNAVIRSWLKSESGSSPPFASAELKTALSSLKDGTGSGTDKYPPELFTKAGTGVVDSILALCNYIKMKKDTPEQWDFVRIVTIYKQKGSKKELKYYRGIFLALIISKIFEKLIKIRIEGNLQKIHLLQAGSRKKRGPPDNVFLFRGVIDHHKFTGKPLYVTAYDFQQAFDSLWLEDCVMSLKDLGVEKEYLQLIYKLNERAVVTVQTPCGPTKEFETDPIVKQGTVLGPCLCSSSTAEYCGKNPGVCVGCVVISSLVFVDDIIDLSSSVEDFLASHQNALLFACKKKLTLSGTKCYWMVINKKAKDVQELELKIGEESIVIPTSEIVYLGDVFNSTGNNDGLIADRVKRGIKAMITVASLMAETEVGVHHVEIMLLLYRCLFLATMLFNSQTWSNLRKKDIEALRTVQLKFLKRILGLPSSTANAFTFLEFGILPIEFEIEKRQLMYLHRILQLSKDDPVVELFWELKKFSEIGESNWWTGVDKCLKKYGLPTDLEVIQTTSKQKFSETVKAAITTVALNQLNAECSALKKTTGLHYRELKCQRYLSVLFPSQARVIFKWRSKTLDIKSHLTYKYGDLVCRLCGVEEETPSHIMNCGHRETIVENTDVLLLDEVDETTKCELKRMIARINLFHEKIDDAEVEK